MGHDIFKFGALYLGNKIQPIPKQPTKDGDIPSYDGKAAISIGSSKKWKGITWVKPNGRSLLITDRVLLNKISWEDLDKNGFVEGKSMLINGQYFRCRLLQVGEDENVPNEWDTILYETCEDNTLWHWSEMYFWGADISALEASYRAARGYHSARFWNDSNCAMNRYANVGFRPALEPLPSDSPIPNVNLDGADFQLTSLPGGDGFCPILQPTQGNVFKDIPVGGKVRMYTFLEGEEPIHFGATVKDVSKLTLTDRYFGDEFLIPWVISNGVAVAAKSMLKQSEN